MKTAYRIPDNDCHCVEPGTAEPPFRSNRFVVRPFITNVIDGAKIRTGTTTLKGIAFDGGKGASKEVASLNRQRSEDMDAGEARQGARQVFVPQIDLPVRLRAGAHDLKYAPPVMAGRRSPWSRRGIPPATCATSSGRPHHRRLGRRIMTRSICFVAGFTARHRVQQTTAEAKPMHYQLPVEPQPSKPGPSRDAVLV